MKQKQFLCTRPSLAALLQQHGQKGEQTISPWDPQRTAWLFDITPELMNVAQQYYGSLNRPLPYALRNIAEAEGEIYE